MSKEAWFKEAERTGELDKAAKANDDYASIAAKVDAAMLRGDLACRKCADEDGWDCQYCGQDTYHEQGRQCPKYHKVCASLECEELALADNSDDLPPDPEWDAYVFAADRDKGVT